MHRGITDNEQRSHCAVGWTKCYESKKLELLNRAVHHNTICSLGTGAGKTFIAVLLIKEYSYHILQYDQKAIFLVDKVALVEQQALHIECHCSLSVGRMHGKLNTGWKNKEEFTAFSNKHNVIVATAQVFLDLLNHAFFDITQAAVIIFDECHHSLGRRHPYRLILDQYRVLPMEKRCRIWD
uniref:Helicase ATP-binding domain-containing protein n=1 Tax=Ditylenchus dipsaci TaxID=166011 RepID=A0A915DBD6_9BILA